MFKSVINKFLSKSMDIKKIVTGLTLSLLLSSGVAVAATEIVTDVAAAKSARYAAAAKSIADSKVVDDAAAARVAAAKVAAKVAAAAKLIADAAAAETITVEMDPENSGDVQAVYETIEQCNGKVGDYYQAYILAKMNLDRVGGGWNYDIDVEDLPEADRHQRNRDHYSYSHTKSGLKKDYATFNSSAQMCDALAEFIKSDDEITF